MCSRLRDDLYIPLGGNGSGVARTCRNLMLTMRFDGQWHGASWTFVFWGFCHGMLLCIYRVFCTTWGHMATMVQRLLLFLTVVIGWVFSRATSFTAPTAP